MNHTLDKATTDREDDVKDLAKPKKTPGLADWLFRAKLSINDINQKEAFGL